MQTEARGCRVIDKADYVSVGAGGAALSTAKMCGEEPVSMQGVSIIRGPCRRKSPKSEAASGDTRNLREEIGRSSPPKPTFGVEEAR